MEAGETELEAAYRETEEEAGFTKDQLTVWSGFEKTLHYEVKGHLKKVVYWLAEVKDGVTPRMSHEHQRFEWLPLSDALERAYFAEMQSALTEADNFIKLSTSKC